MRIADCGLRIADCGLRIADCGLQIADCRLQIAELAGGTFLQDCCASLPFGLPLAGCLPSAISASLRFPWSADKIFED
jgi:hypothetical protein